MHSWGTFCARSPAVDRLGFRSQEGRAWLQKQRTISAARWDAWPEMYGHAGDASAWGGSWDGSWGDGSWGQSSEDMSPAELGFQCARDFR